MSLTIRLTTPCPDVATWELGWVEVGGAVVAWLCAPVALLGRGWIGEVDEHPDTKKMVTASALASVDVRPSACVPMTRIMQ